MSPKLKRLSGKEVLSILSKIGFLVHSQKGSHVKLKRDFFWRNTDLDNSIVR